MTTLKKEEAKEYLNLLKALKPDEHEILVSSIRKIKAILVDNLTNNTEIASEEDKLIQSLTRRSYSQAERIKLEMDTLLQGTTLIRIFDPSKHQTEALTFRYFGPLHRFDHHNGDLGSPQLHLGASLAPLQWGKFHFCRGVWHTPSLR